jgi:DNA processing protein
MTLATAPMTDQEPPPSAAEPASEADRLARAALARLFEADDMAMGRLLDAYGSASATWAALLDTSSPLPPKVTESWRTAARVQQKEHPPERDLDAARRVGGRFVVPGDAEWPDDRLAPLALGAPSEPHVPIGLYLRGPLNLFEATRRAIAIVGTRASTDYGETVACDFATSLADHDWTIVSGLAYGVDGAAHKGAFAVGGSTIAVVATGFDVTYPAGHKHLLDRLVSDGLIVTEKPPGTGATRLRFLNRNRVIAALADATVVVEMDVRSGARNTLKHARRLRRPVMAVPGPIDSPTSLGCHLEIRRGDAVMVTSASEVAEVAGRIGEDLAAEPVVPPDPRDLLPTQALQLLDAFPAQRSADLDALVEASRLPREEVERLLPPLTQAGFVEPASGGHRLTEQGRA